MRVIDLITEFKQFLNAQGSSLGTIALILAGCVVALSFAAREILTWMTRADKVRAELEEIRETLRNIENRLERGASANPSSDSTAWLLDKKAQEPETFKLNH